MGFSLSRKFNCDLAKVETVDLDCYLYHYYNLLVFLLIKTELKLNKISSKNSDDILDNILRSISKWVRADNEKIKEFLVLINIIKKIKLDSKSTQDDSEENELMEKMNNFIVDIKGKIEAIEKNIVLS